MHLSTESRWDGLIVGRWNMQWGIRQDSGKCAGAANEDRLAGVRFQLMMPGDKGLGQCVTTHGHMYAVLFDVE